jgi:hypothetical protein
VLIVIIISRLINHNNRRLLRAFFTLFWLHSRQLLTLSLVNKLEIFSSIRVYSSLTKENKLLFSVSICSKQQKFTISHFPLAANKWSYRFLSVLFSIYIYIQYIKTTAYIYTKNCTIYKLLFQTEKGKRKPRRFSLIRYHLLIVQTEVCCLSVC